VKDETGIDSWIQRAVEFHGHLGPFLVIGIRMGNLAKKTLNLNTENMHKLRVTVGLPLFTPYSCTLDGIQITTGCTIGNQKLRIKASKGIMAHFEIPNLKKLLQISVNPTVMKELAEKMAKGTASDKLAREIAPVPENELFVLENNKLF